MDALPSFEVRDAVARLSHAHGAGERRAALFALLLTPGSGAELRAWRQAVEGVAGAERLRADVAALPRALQLPVFEALLDRSRTAPLPERQALVEGARRLMGADGQVSPLDRLRWLAMRHRLGEAPRTAPTAALSADAAELPLAALVEFAAFSAFLARELPEPSADGGIGPSGAAWHARALQPWSAPLEPLGGSAPLCRVPDGERTLQALRTLQRLSWMTRPVLLRAWLDALEPPGAAGLSDDARDALRLAATLLDVPAPEALMSRYLDLGWA
ncbi:MAG TPA: hypothetical protein VNV16_12955 [Methylibium sp.]|nr:hypothetical protein [Methylibium sp.]